LDEESTRAIELKSQNPISKGNLQQVPDFCSYASWDSFIDQFLSLESIEKKYNQSQPHAQGPLAEFLYEMASLEFEPLSIFAA
jgi:hypothetical protein